MNKALTSTTLNRLELSKLARANVGRHIRIAVHRNHSFEMIANVMNAFLAESGLYAEFKYSSYDDSLAFAGEDADVHVIWLDAEKYHIANLPSFVADRIIALRKITNSPILVGVVGLAEPLQLPVGSYLFPVNGFLSQLGDAAYDLPKEPYSGTRISSRASLELSRQFGLRYLPAILYPPLKAIVVDLDNTLYSGILGEDGPEKIVPNVELQKALLKFKKSGGLLAISSKNDERDVRELFEKRTDFPLHWSDFAATSIGWHDKQIGIGRIAESMNILPDSILFIDDNPAEIQNVSGVGVRCLLADHDVANTLRLTPGVLRLRKSDEDVIRTRDIQSNVERLALAESMDIDEYFARLKICLRFSLDCEAQVPRISELLGKTNQFVLGYSRMSEAEVLEWMHSSDACVVTINMSDSLSDSGIIAIAVTRRDQRGRLLVSDLTVSCRALGRKLENIMLPYMLQSAAKKLQCNGDVCIAYRRGPRNAPALTWLSDVSGMSLGESGSVAVDLSKPIDFHGVSVEVDYGTM